MSSINQSYIIAREFSDPSCAVNKKSNIIAGINTYMER
jgi:hypothetical protein